MHIVSSAYDTESTFKIKFGDILEFGDFSYLEKTWGCNSQDDNIVWRRTLQGYDKRLAKIFLETKESGLNLNKSKSQIWGKVHCIVETHYFIRRH